MNERFVLTENAWSVRSSEVLADISYCTTAFLAILIAVILNPSQLALPCLVVLGLGLGFYFYLLKLDSKPYFFSLLFHSLLVFLLVPIPMLHPLGIALAYVSGALFYFFANQNFSLKLESTFFILFFFFFWEAILQVFGFKFGGSPESLSLPFLGEVASSSLGPKFSAPWFLGKEALNLPFRSLFEFFSSFLFIFVSLASFRRPILFLAFFIWVLNFYLFSFVSGEFGIPEVLSYSSLAFIILTGPGKNHYTLFFPNLFLLLGCLPISWLFASIGIPPLWLIVFFFLFQSVVTRVFLGK